MFSDPEFRQWAKDSSAQQLAFVESALKDKATEPLGQLCLQHLAASWGRIHHPSRLGTAVLNPDNRTGETLRILIGDAFIDPVVQICVAHSWDRKRVVEDRELRTRELGHSGEPVRLRLVAALLRLGDLLDMGKGRVSELLWDYLRPLLPLSDAHWRKEFTLDVELCQPNLIRLAGEFVPKGGAQASMEERHIVAEAYRLAREWIAWLDAEIKDCTRLVETRIREEARHAADDADAPRIFGVLKLDADAVHAPHLAFDGPVSFELNRKRILQLLGDEIYTQGAVFVRELLQNALDATRAAILRKHAALAESEPTKYPSERPWDWPSEVLTAPEWTIEVETGEEQVSDRQLVTFVVRDRGIGMTLDQIRGHFLQVGLSFYRTPEFRGEFNFPPISRFGIGFLSCLSVAQRIEVATRAAKQDFGLRLSIQRPSEQYVVEKDSTLEQGTTVRLWIDPERVDAANWSRCPVDAWNHCRFLKLPHPPKHGQWPDILAAAAQQWLAAPDTRVLINAVEWGPRKLHWHPEVLKDDPRAPGAGYVSCRTRLLGTSGRVIAEGDFLLSAFKGGLPSSWQHTSMFESRHFGEPTVRALHGVWITHDNFDGDAAWCWNYRYLPKRKLSASRVWRGRSMTERKQQNELRARLEAYTLSELTRRDEETAALWRLITRTQNNPAKLPFRADGTLRWVSLADAEKLAPRFLIVPFGVAWKGLGNPCLPVFGVASLDSPSGNLPIFDGASADQFTNCPLVEIPETCTAYLWPPTAKVDDLPQLRWRTTYLKYGFAVMMADVRNPLVGHGRGVNPELLLKSDRAPYDQGENPWKKQGLVIQRHFAAVFKDEDCGKEVRERLDNAKGIEYPPHLLDLVIEDGDDWE